MDIDMPVMNGFDTTLEIIDYYKSINKEFPVIVACSALVD